MDVRERGESSTITSAVAATTTRIGRAKGARRLLPRYVSLVLLFVAVCIAQAPAQRVSSERPDEDGENQAYAGWHEVETEHFRIIFEPGDADAAREVAGFAEEVYEEVTGTLGYYPDTVPVVLRGRTARANGFYSPFPHRINLFVTSPSGPQLGAKHTNWLRLLLTHELTHYVQFADRTGFFGALSRLFGHEVSVFSFPFTPGWYIEGLTTFNETRFSTGGRGRNPFFEMQIKAPILEAKLWSLDQAGYGSPFAPRGRIYISGYALTEHLIAGFGEDTFREIHREFERWPILGVGRAVEKVTGTDYEEVYADMQAGLIRRFADDARLPVGRRVSPPEPGNWYLPVRTDAGLFGYVDTLDRRAGIYLMPAGPGDGDDGLSFRQSGRSPVSDIEPVLPVRLTDAYSFDVTRDGSRIVFTMTESAPRHRAGLASYSNLHLLDRDTGERRALSEDARLWHPAISADGEQIVAVERRGSYSRLVEVDPESGDRSTLYEPEQASVFTPRFGPRGNRIVFTEHTRGYQDVMLFENGDVRPLVEHGVRNGNEAKGGGGAEGGANSGRSRSAEFFPRFAGSDSVLFSSDRDGRLSLYRYEISTQTLQRVVEDRIVAWSGIPYGEGILYGSYTSDGYTLRYADLASGGAADTAGATDAGRDGEQSEGPPEPPQWEPLPESVRYFDLPKPLVWAPYFELYADSEGELRVPIGVYLYGAGLLQRVGWDSVLAFDTRSGHPRAGLTISYDPGPLELGYEFDYRYRLSPQNAYRASLSHELTAGTQSWYRRHPSAVSRLVTAAGTAFEAQREDESGEEFTFDKISSATDHQREVSAFGAARLSYDAFAPPKAYYGGFAADAWMQADYTPALLDRPDHRVDTAFGGGVQVPSGFAHQLIGLELDGVSSTSGTVAGNLLPRSGARWESGDGDLKLTGTLDYRIPLGVYDRPLLGPRPYKPALLALGATIYAESSVYADVDTGVFAPEDSIRFGLESTGQFTAMRLPIEAGLGVAARVDRSFSQPPGNDDWHVYVVLSSIPVSRVEEDPLTEWIRSPRSPRGERTRSATTDSFGP